ncbi:MAG: Sir2 family NAD-dependent protein deacetylase, partial [Planctomycetota bacterium]
ARCMALECGEYCAAVPHQPTLLLLTDSFQIQVWNWCRGSWLAESTFEENKVLAAEPNAGHLALAELESLVPRLTLVTQNVDGLHQRAGSPHVIELHGSLLHARCFERGHRAATWPACVPQNPPRCDVCGGRMRPDVVWFHESLPTAALEEAEQAVLAADLFFSIGTSAVVYPAAGLGMLASERGATVIEINPSATPLTPHADHVLHEPSGRVLPDIIACLRDPPGSTEARR